MVDNEVHCDGDCPHLQPYGDEYDLTARCDLTYDDLQWYDFWIRICDDKKEIDK